MTEDIKKIIKEHYRKIGSMRWANVSPEERSRIMREIGAKGKASRWGKKKLAE
jgi:hypothetical protein